MLKDSVLLSAHRLARSVSTLIITMMLARALSVEDMGIYQLILIITITVGSFVPFEFPTTFSYFYNKTNKNTQKQSVISNTILFLFLLGSLTFLIIVTGSKLGLFLSNEIFEPYTFWIALWCFAVIAGSYLENLYVSTENAKIFSFYSLGYYFVFFSTASILIYQFNNLLFIVKMIALFEIIRLISLKLIFFKKQPIVVSIDPGMLKKQVGYTMAAGAVTAITVINTYTDKILIHLYYPIEQFAIFAIAAREIPFVLTITASVVTAMLPKLSHLFNVDSNPDASLRLWKNTSSVLCVIIFPMFWILLFYHQEYLSLIYSDKYLSASAVFIVYLIKFPLGFTVFYTLLLISGNQRLVLKNTLIVVSLNLIFSIIALLIFGMYGVAVATVLTAFFGAYLQQKDVCHVFNIKQRELLPYFSIMRTFLSSGVLTAGVYLLVYFLPVHQYIKFLVGGTMIMVLSVYLSYLFKDIELNVITSKLNKNKKTA